MPRQLASRVIRQGRIVHVFRPEDDSSEPACIPGRTAIGARDVAQDGIGSVGGIFGGSGCAQSEVTVELGFDALFALTRGVRGGGGGKACDCCDA